jgi:hypothetical protein
MHAKEVHAIASHFLSITKSHFIYYPALPPFTPVSVHSPPQYRPERSGSTLEDSDGMFRPVRFDAMQCSVNELSEDLCRVRRSLTFAHFITPHPTIQRTSPYFFLLPTLIRLCKAKENRQYQSGNCDVIYSCMQTMPKRP